MRKFCLLLSLAAALSAGEKWPFGGGGGMFNKRDFYNLGLLGAKAMDASLPPPANTAPRSGKRAFQIDKPTHDDGPEALRIQMLYPGGPAAKAGLAEGDVIVGAGAKRFKDGSLGVLAKALLKAEAGKGEVALLVKKQGTDKTTKITVAIPVGGTDAGKPTKGKGRRALIDGALAWLAKRQAEDGGYAETLSGKNGAVVQASLAGLAWVGAGNDLEKGPYKENVRKAAEWVSKAVRDMVGGGFGVGREPGGPSWNQNNWGWAHAAIFLGELHLRTPDRGVLDALTFCATKLVETQEKSGGWAHGPGGKNALGYLELNIVTGLALSGLGLAHRNGFEVPDETLARAEEYLKASGSGGGIGYSAANRGGGNIGRTAGCWLGYRALGRGKTKFGKSMGAFVKREADNVLGGHASLMQHILLGGVAAHVHSTAAAKAYWKTMERDLVLARAPDGSFQPRPWHETLGMKSNSDVTFGEVWTTAAWTCVLVSAPAKPDTPGFPGWSGR